MLRRFLCRMDSTGKTLRSAKQAELEVLSGIALELFKAFSLDHFKGFKIFF